MDIDTVLKAIVIFSALVLLVDFAVRIIFSLSDQSAQYEFLTKMSKILRSDLSVEVSLLNMLSGLPGHECEDITEWHPATPENLKKVDEYSKIRVNLWGFKMPFEAFASQAKVNNIGLKNNNGTLAMLAVVK